MYKIRSIKSLCGEKKRLEQRRLELEKAIRYDWLDVKESLKPKNIADQILTKTFEKEKQNGTSSLANTISQLAAVLTKMTIQKAEERLHDWMKNKK